MVSCSVYNTGVHRLCIRSERNCRVQPGDRKMARDHLRGPGDHSVPVRLENLFTGPALTIGIINFFIIFYIAVNSEF
jgi:hypothetical protein